MSKKAKKQSKIIRRRFRRSKINVGTLMFIIIVVYIVFTANSYRKRDQVKFYEVEEGSLVKEHNYEGIILREEQIVESGASGYLNYYIPEGRKTAKGGAVYSIDESGRLRSYLESQTNTVGEMDDRHAMSIRSYLTGFSTQYRDENFRAVYDMNASLQAQVTEYTNMTALSELSEELKSAGISFTRFDADATGTVSYVIDGYEELLPEAVEESMFDQSKYQPTIIKSGDMIESGTPAYKLITSDAWQIVFPISANALSEFADKDALKISFTDPDITTTADFATVRGADGNSYGLLSLSRYMVQFISQRFISFEVVTNDVSGLKIPEKSITEKDFYIVPVDYLKTDDRGNEGFLKEVVSEAGTSQQFVTVDIYNKDESYCYIESAEGSALTAGDYISKPDAPESRYQIGPMKPLQGVYNINKGYTVFKQIEPYENATANGYTIIRQNTPYGLSVYDHIVLDAASVGDGQLIYR